MNTVVQACIGQTTKDEATVNLDTFGLTVFDIFRLMMRRILPEKRLPFDPIVPNATTLAAIDDANRGGLDSIEKLFANLRDRRDDCWNDLAAPLVQLRLPPRRHRTAPQYCPNRHPSAFTLPEMDE
ncbi:MAG: type II toxin-antitoxin system RelB/DinJ family antitoxin [Thiotrichales bacterium]|nr:type II toxin-antitoxin system RelB/DinJ family antitoxin [Thiotrichales bacterium]